MTRQAPSWASSTRSIFMDTSPDQSREKRTVTDRPATRRSATDGETVAAKYHLELVMSLPTAPAGAAGSWAMSCLSPAAVRSSSMSGEIRLS